MKPTPQSWLPRRRNWSRQLEKIALGIEKPTNRLIGNYHLNPFYHTGTISLFLFIIVGLTGVYLYLFFQYGFEASYNAVQTRIETPFLARMIRAVHRYASDALVVTVLLHAFRTLFMENFRGPRRLAWLTGIFMTFILWLAGITGYWLIWDTRAQVINDHFIDFLQKTTPFANDYIFILTRAQVIGESWPIFFVGFLVHLGLFLIVAFFFWLHTRHLKRVRLLPPKAWMAGAGIVLVVIAIFFPAGMLPAADPAQLPGTVRLDPIYLYYLPVRSWGWSGLLWLCMWGITAWVVALPWISKWRGGSAENPLTKQPLVKVLNDKCTGCAKCANDCPYGALTMVERDDDSKFDMLAIADPSRCVGCGICVGSCDEFLAITLGDVPPDSTWMYVEDKMQAAQVQAPDTPLKVIFTCNRHADWCEHSHAGVDKSKLSVKPVIVPLPCTGAIPPYLLPKTLAAGAVEVEIVGCPPFDCINREGNIWEEQRMTNERVPRVRRKHDHAPITASWLPPDEFAQTLELTMQPDLEEGEDKPDYVTERSMFEWLSWRNVAAGIGLLAAVLLAQVWLTGLEFTPYAADSAEMHILLANPASGWGKSVSTATDLPLLIEVDGQIVAEHQLSVADLFSTEPTPFFTRLDLPIGEHTVRVSLYSAETHIRIVHYLQHVTISSGDIIHVHDLKAEQFDECNVTICDE